MTVLEAFYLSNFEAIENAFQQKKLLACEIMGKLPRRSLRPDLVGDRSRLDLMWNGKGLGVRGSTKQDGSFDFFVVQKPDSASDSIKELLETWLAEPPPNLLNLAQVRFRSGWQGIRGIWIDTSNENIQKLLAEGNWLLGLLEKKIVVEVGQKHKEVATDPNRGLKLVPSEPRCWLQGFDQDNRDIPLLSSVSHFSQPGPESNRSLVAGCLDLLDAHQVPNSISWIEWGSGYGNFTPFLASRLGPKGLATELDPSLGQVLELNKIQFFSSVQIGVQPAEKGPSPDWNPAELWFLDPPRSGFGRLLEFLKNPEISRPRFVLVLHCHANGLIADTAILKSSGYKLLDWVNADVFPATPHHEVISLWQNSI